ncbi:IS66 family transposase [Janthinobacterium sp. PC23-8]|uniref:IS66 family transposase n=1 Tax=Janthinobacterium sp. PC23-8 TaxID=2012679 RepID=UPI0020CCC411|nr:IS66 family transposase [Janthinobacterium sp. PC23-8]
MAKKRTSPDFSALTRGELEGVVLTLWERLETLESKVSKNSSNSSQPPSSDGLRKTNSLREPSGKPPGAQPGHKGNTLKRMAEPSQIETHQLPEQCERCGCALDQEAAEIVERRQVIDTPVVACDIVEHRVLALRCTCGQRHRSVFPTTVTQAVQYGPNVRALGVHLTQGQLLPFARAAQLINDLYGIAISPATLLAWVDEARVALQATADTIADSLRAAPLVHADESGLRVQGKLHWLHVAANDSHTWYGVHAKRGMEAIATQAILPQRLGVLVHDCWAPYWQLAGRHALCNAHLLRELLYVQELTGERWPARMSELLLRANELCEAARHKNIALGAADVAALRTFYDAILSEGERRHPARLKPSGKAGRVKQCVAFNLLLRLRRYADAVLLFVSDPAVPFTNNLGERAIRMPKVK